MRIINREFNDNSIIVIPILFYIGIISFNFSQNSFNILFFFIIPLSFFYCLFSALYLIFKRKSVKSLLPKILILFLPLLIFPIIKISKLLENQIILEAKNDGKNLYLYSNNEFKLSEISLLGTNNKKGTYKIVKNEIILTYDSVEFYMNKTTNLKIENNNVGDMKILKYNCKHTASH